MFGLEFLQGKHNGVISNSGNASASVDPKQIPNDATEVLLKGAEKAAAGSQLGLSEEETLAATSRQYRRQQQRDAYRNRNERQAQWEQKQKSLIDEGFQIDSPDTDLEGRDEVAEVFGLTDYEAGLRDLDADNGIDPSDREFEREPVAPKSVLRDALTRLQSGSNQFGMSAVPGMADAQSRLEDDLAYGPEQRDVERDYARQMVLADAARSSARRQGYSDVKAAIEADAISEQLYRPHRGGALTSAMVGDVNLDRISAGYNPQYPDAVMPAMPGGSGLPTDPMTGNPIGQQTPELPGYLTQANRTSTANTLNAPDGGNTSTAASWIIENLPRPRSGSGVPSQDPQTDITLATTQFAQKLRELDGFGLQNVSSNVRSASELQKVADYVTAKAAELGQPIFAVDPVTRKQTPVLNPGVGDVVNMLGLSGPEQQQLANALFQTELAMPTTNNEAYRAREPRAQFNDNITFGDMSARLGSTPVARVGSGSKITVGLDANKEPVRRGVVSQGGSGRRDIKTLLASLEGEDAQRPYIGQVEGEKPRIFRYKRGGMGSGDEMAARLTMQAETRAKRDKKPVNQEQLRSSITKARLIEERMKRDERKAEQARRSAQPPALAAADNAFIDEARKRIQGSKERSEVEKLIELAAFGRQYPVEPERAGSEFAEGRPARQPRLDLIQDLNDPNWDRTQYRRR